MNDSLTASKVRAALLDNKDVTLTSLKVTVDRGIAYLMGTVTQREADIITAVAAKVPESRQSCDSDGNHYAGRIGEKKVNQREPSAVTENGSPDRSRNNSYKLK